MGMSAWVRGNGLSAVSSARVWRVSCTRGAMVVAVYATRGGSLDSREADRGSSCSGCELCVSRVDGDTH